MKNLKLYIGKYILYRIVYNVCDIEFGDTNKALLTNALNLTALEVVSFVRLKTWFRSIMGEDRLTGLTF